MFDDAKAYIRKSGFYASQPWVIDIRFDNGDIWQSWAYRFKTKKSAIQHCEAVGVEVG
jgi:hypothetical protein